MIYPDSFERKIGFDSVRSLVIGKCVSPLGVAWCEQMSFMTDYRAVDESLTLTAEMLHIINGPTDFPLHQLRDVTGLLRRITVPGTFLTTDEVVSLRKSLEAIAEVSTFMSDVAKDESKATQYPKLRQLTSTLDTFPAVVRSIDRLIDRYGNIKDNASPELATIRQQLKSISGSINSIMRRVMSRAVAEGLIEGDAAPSVRDGRLVIPVPPMHKRKINGIVHDESASGKTIFIEPAEVVEANNRYRELEMEERREINRLLVELANEIRPEIPSMLDSYEVMGQRDFIHAKALFAQEVGGSLPHISMKPEMEWYHATHPILLLSLRKHDKDIVPLDINLSDKNRLLIISGPNAGGKSVCLKTVGIIQYMTQSGLLPPVYENSHIGLFDDIFIDIGDDQSIEDDLSTYSSHLRNMKLMLSKGRSTSLVLIDEFGGGTEPQIGGAIAQAMLKQFNN
ncbi:MAG: endonuclease MutS2, partial [Muribaculaceae bacterium]|nr:endonuclease MutS2 [Muribaculaceae bacterium]